MQESEPEMSHDKIKEIEQKAEGGDINAQVELGRIHYKKKQYDKAAKWFKKAEMGRDKASFEYAYLCELGHGVTLNYHEAIVRYALIQNTCPRSQYRLGVMYENGFGLEKDLCMAAKYYEKASKGKVTGASNALKNVQALINEQRRVAHVQASQRILERTGTTINEVNLLLLGKKQCEKMESGPQHQTCTATENEAINKIEQNSERNDERNKLCQTSESVAVSDKEGEKNLLPSEKKVELNTTDLSEPAPVDGSELVDAPLTEEFQPSEQSFDEAKKSSEVINIEQKNELSVISETDGHQRMVCSEPSCLNKKNHDSLQEAQKKETDVNQHPVSMEEIEPLIENIDESKAKTLDIKNHQVADISSNWECREPEAGSPWPKKHQYQKVDQESGLFIARRRGRSHEHDAKFCDDDGDYWCHPSGWTVLAVADGAGSADYSREGSRVAVSTVIEEMQCWFTPERITECDLYLQNWQSNHNKFHQLFYIQFFEICKKTITKIKALAEINNFKERQFATTLLVTVSKTVSGTTYVATLWIGDGAITAYRSGASRLLGRPDSGAFVGQTRFLDANYLQQHYSSSVSIAAIERAESLILMTDGVSDPKFKSDAEIEDSKYWDLLWQEIKPKLESENPGISLLEWLHFTARGYHDDRTIAISLVKMDKDEK